MQHYRQHLREQWHRRYPHRIQKPPLQIGLSVEEQAWKVCCDVGLHFFQDSLILS